MVLLAVEPKYALNPMSLRLEHLVNYHSSYQKVLLRDLIDPLYARHNWFPLSHWVSNQHCPVLWQGLLDLNPGLLSSSRVDRQGFSQGLPRSGQTQLVLVQQLSQRLK